MHDLMHDLATIVARSETVLIDQTEDTSWDKNVRHVSSYYPSKSMVDSVCSFSHSKSLRTFLCPCVIYFNDNISLGNNDLKKLMLALRSLRVLDLSDLRIRELPTSIGELIHLRSLTLTWSNMERLPGSICRLCHLQYLILRDCANLKEVPEELGDLLSLRFLEISRSFRLERLPGSICSLQHLQSLILRGCYSLKELPEGLGNLLSLRHLVLEGCDMLNKMPAGLAALTSLVTLDKIVVDDPSGGLKYLEGLDNLTGSLQIVLPSIEWENSKMDAERSFLSRKSRLRALEIIHVYPESVSGEPVPDTTANTGMNALQPPPDIVDLSIGNFGGKEMPQWVLCLHKLVILKLKGCDKCIVLPSFSLLPSLKELYISDMSSIVAIEESMFHETDSFFPSLETLSIEKMPNLKSWWLQAPTVLPTFPRVTNVTIQHCPKLTRFIPLFPLVEGLCLEDVPAEIIWIEVTFSDSHGSNVLKKLVIKQIEDLSSIAEGQIRHLSALQELRIWECKQLKSVSCNGLSYLTSLELLQILSCEQFNWDGQEAEVGRIHLPRVRYLEIPTANTNLFKGLKYMASLETLEIAKSFNQVVREEEQALPWKQLQKLQWLRLGFEETFSMRSNQRLLHGIEDLTSLYSLTLKYCKELYLSWGALLRLPNLQMVTISEVGEVVDVDSDPMMIQTQPISRSIRDLTIEGGLGEWVNDIPWKSFPFLKNLRLTSIRNLEELPEGIQHLAALEDLMIWGCCDEPMQKTNRGRLA